MRILASVKLNALDDIGGLGEPFNRLDIGHRIEPIKRATDRQNAWSPCERRTPGIVTVMPIRQGWPPYPGSDRHHRQRDAEAGNGQRDELCPVQFKCH
jgi:hypothetical protein